MAARCRTLSADLVKDGSLSRRCRSFRQNSSHTYNFRLRSSQNLMRYVMVWLQSVTKPMPSGGTRGLLKRRMLFGKRAMCNITTCLIA